MRLERAVVIGGSIAGMLTAAAAAKHFEKVTVVERDELRDDPAPRKGAPQGNQIHILLPIGERFIETIFPGIHEEFIEAGCEEYDIGAEVAVLGRFGWNLRVEVGKGDVVAFRRPLLELVIRRRAASLPNIEIRQGSVAGLIPSADGREIVGLALKGGETILADLVVDASGRGTKTPKWLRELGFDAPQEDEVRIFMGYATQFVRVPEGSFDAGLRGIASSPWPGHPVGGVVMPADNGVHALTAVGMMKTYPPADREGVLEFLEGAASPLVAEIARASEPVSDIHTYRQPGNLRRRWEKLGRRPGCFVAVGDAVASFNPIYGQGITMAALGATLLDEALGAPGATLDSVPAAFQESLSSGIDVAFEMASSGDSLCEGAELANFQRPSPEEAAYSERLQELATRDPEVQAKMLQAGFWLQPELLETEEMKAKARAAGPGAREGDPGVWPEVVYRLTSTG